MQVSYYSDTYTKINRDSATCTTLTTAKPSYTTVTIPGKTSYAQNVVYRYYGGQLGRSTYIQTSTSSTTLQVELNENIEYTCNPKSNYLQSNDAITSAITHSQTLSPAYPRFKTPTLNSLSNSPDDTILILDYQSPVGCYMR